MIGGVGFPSWVGARVHHRVVVFVRVPRVGALGVQVPPPGRGRFTLQAAVRYFVRLRACVCMHE